MGIACIMSKFQHSSTFIVGALYSLWSLLEWASIALAAYFYLINNTEITPSSEYLEALIYGGAVGFFYLLNLTAVLVQNCFLRGDDMFCRWRDKQGANTCSYYFSSSWACSSLTHKFKNK